jgi:hypothetical protein
MLKFEPRFNVSVLALASRQKDSIESNKPGKHRAGILTVVIQINPHRTTLNKSNTVNRFKLETRNSMPKRTWR